MWSFRKAKAVKISWSLSEKFGGGCPDLSVVSFPMRVRMVLYQVRSLSLATPKRSAISSHLAIFSFAFLKSLSPFVYRKGLSFRNSETWVSWSTSRCRGSARTSFFCLRATWELDDEARVSDTVSLTTVRGGSGEWGSSSLSASLFLFRISFFATRDLGILLMKSWNRQYTVIISAMYVRRGRMTKWWWWWGFTEFILFKHTTVQPRYNRATTAQQPRYNRAIICYRAHNRATTAHKLATALVPR